MTGGQYLLSGWECPDITMNIDFVVWEGRSLGCFVLLSGSKAMFMLECPISQPYIYALFNVCKEVTTMDYSVFVEDAYRQHNGCYRQSSQML